MPIIIERCPKCYRGFILSTSPWDKMCWNCKGTGWVENQKISWGSNEQMIKNEEELYK